MDDKRLWRLLKNLQQQTPESQEWRLNMKKLLTHIQRLPELKQVPHPDYLEALNKTLEWVWCNIGSFEPRPPSVEKSLVNWVNGYLYWRIKDLYIRDQTNTVSLDKSVADNGEAVVLLDQLSTTRWSSVNCSWYDNPIQKLETQEFQRLCLELSQAIELDLHGKLKSIYPQGRNDCNCKLLSQKLLFQDPPDSLKSLARQLKINDKTLSSHWKKKCKPCLQKMAIELDYQPE